MSKQILLSVCTFQDGTFDAIFRDPETGQSVMLHGTQKIEGDDLDFLMEVAPACVFTRYARVEK